MNDEFGGYDQAVINDLRQQTAALNRGLAAFQIDFSKELDDFENQLAGVFYDEEKSVWVQQYEPMLNKAGRVHVMHRMRSTINKVTAQSNYDISEVKTWCRELSKSLIADVANHGDDWELEFANYTSLVEMCMFKTFGIMKAAFNAGLREIIGKISSVRETHNMVIPQDQKRASI